jgi:hypothetical protein
MGKILTYSAVLIGVYLLVSHATDAGTLLKAGSSAYSGAVQTLQGR